MFKENNLVKYTLIMTKKANKDNEIFIAMFLI